MYRRGHADLPLHGGRVPEWLRARMAALGGAIVEAVVWHYGRRELLVRLSDPYWFQALGCVLGMDWHSSGITTSVLGALKRGLAPMADSLGVYVCGGRGAQSRRTPEELRALGGRVAGDAEALVQCSRLSAKIDNTAVQDGFQLYLHGFVVTREGEWAVVQQGMNPAARLARRYHWLSTALPSFVETPHAAVVGENQGTMLNLTDVKAAVTRASLVAMAREHPDAMAAECRLVMRSQHALRATDVDLRRLAAVLVTAHDRGVQEFAELLLCPGLGPRTLQSLVLVSEVIHGTPSRFRDPARFSFAHGGKDGHPFPVPLRVYDQSIGVLRQAVDHAKLGQTDKVEAIRCLDRFVRRAEAAEPTVDFEELVAHERAESPRHGGRTVFGPARPPRQRAVGPEQLTLW
jgi:hypothetical protein